MTMNDYRVQYVIDSKLATEYMVASTFDEALMLFRRVHPNAGILSIVLIRN